MLPLAHPRSKWTLLLIAGMSTALRAACWPQDLQLAMITDPVIHDEIAAFQPYQEWTMVPLEEALTPLPLRSWSPSHLEFCGNDLRVRMETFPFTQTRDVRKMNGRYTIDRDPILGWSPGVEHNRLARMEVVVDGTVVPVPVNAILDVFDAPLTANEGRIHFADVRRSRDGWRIYVHLQAGEGAQALIVTWVIEDGRFQYRVVDPLPG